VDWEQVFAEHSGEDCWFGVDGGKHELFTVLRWRTGGFERPWRVANPGEVASLVPWLAKFSKGRRLIVAMEPSGTYLDALRQALGDVGVEAHWVSPKQSHDFAEVFDGVPSQHDGKDAAVIAELAAIDKSRPWPYRHPSEAEQELVSGVEWIDIHRREKAAWCGRVEGLLARHWPEVKELLSMRSITLLRALAHYGGPRVLAADAEAASRLQKWGGRFLNETKIQDLIRSAASTVGVRPTNEDLLRLARYASKALAADAEIKQARRALKRLAAKNPVITAMATVVGVVTACVLWVYLGDPRDYVCGSAYRKAMGLNLKERSSGQWKGRLKISKRGHSAVRRWLYFSALRMIHQRPVQVWYQAKKAKSGGKGRPAVIGVMRKLALALFHVARGATFEPSRLFPGRRVPAASRKGQ
jgi:transposase